MDGKFVDGLVDQRQRLGTDWVAAGERCGKRPGGHDLSEEY